METSAAPPPIGEIWGIAGVRALPYVAPIALAVFLLCRLTGDPAAGDEWISHAVQHMALGSMLASIGVVLADPYIRFGVWAIGALAALRTRNWTLLAAAFLVLAALNANPILKELFSRSRPGAGDVIIRTPATGYGFPSGHTSTATLFYGYSALALGSVTSRGVARACIAAALFAIGLVAFERVYDGVHWPSDVAGGFTSGVLLIALSVAAAHTVTLPMRWYRSTASGPAPPHDASTDPKAYTGSR